MAESPIKVLYIAGAGRSGSTLLANILGTGSGFESVGELYYLWDRGLVENRSCGCGREFAECAFWGAVRDNTSGRETWNTEHGSLMTARRQGLLGRRQAHSWRSEPQAERQKRFLDELGGLYSDIHEVTGSQVVVDSSKLPSYAMAISHLPRVQVYLCHLTRDPRAVVHSWSRKKSLGGSGAPIYFRQFSASRAAQFWMTGNVGAELAAKSLQLPYLRVRYEDLMTSPRETLASIARLVDEPLDIDDLVVGDKTVRIDESHTISGNPSRFQSGDVILKSDDGWTEALPPRSRRVTNIITWPLMRRYGYKR